MKTIFAFTIVCASLTMIAGCGGSSSNASDVSAGSLTTVSIDGSKYVLADEPDGAVGVIGALASASDGQPIVVVGRIGGATNPWIEGRAAFTLLDASKAIVAEGTDSGDNEMCMGDCCALERAACTVLVKVVDESGRVLAADSRQLFGLAANDMVVVRGKVSKDESGNIALLADGVHIRQ